MYSAILDTILLWISRGLSTTLIIHLLSTWRNGLPHKVSRLSILGVLAALFGEVARTMTMLEI
jgi:hypothetical protein